MIVFQALAHDDPCGARTPWDLVSVFFVFRSLAYALTVVVVVVLRFDNPLSLIFDSSAICLMVFFSNYA